MIAGLRPDDVTDRHADRLRTRCHHLLRRQASAPEGKEDGTPFWRIIGPALAGGWCLAYLLEIVRRTAALYGF